MQSQQNPRPQEELPPPEAPRSVETQIGLQRPSGGGLANLGGGMNLKGILPSIVVLAVVLGILFYGVKPVSQADFTSNLQSVAKDIADLKTGQATIQSSITAMQTTVNTAGGLSGRMDQTDRTLTSLSSSISSMQQRENTLASNYDAFNAQVSALNKSIADQNRLITTLQDTLTGLDTRLKKLEAATVPSTSPPTITSFSPTNGATGTPVVITGTNFIGATSVTFGGTSAVFTVNSATQITATVGSGATGAVGVSTPAGSVSNGTFTYSGGTTSTGAPLTVTVQPGWGGTSPIMGFNGTPIANNVSATTQTGTFSIQMTNSSSATLHNIRLNVGLAFLSGDAKSVIPVPAGMTVTVSLVSQPMTSWTQVYTGQKVLGFENDLPVIGNLGELTQTVGSSLQTVMVTVTIPVNVVVPGFNIYPTADVAS